MRSNERKPDNAARAIESRSHTSFGDELTSNGSGARTSYIGREHDNETDLGFYGVRLYEPEYGRFLSTDVLWGEFPQTATYVYADNEPITKKDPSGAIWETIWDVANVVVDGVRVAYHLVKGNKEEAKGAAADLAADGLATLVPGLPAGLTKLRHADEVVDAAKTADKVVDASKAGKKGADGAEQVGKSSADALGAQHRVRSTKSGDKAITVTRGDGTVVDISPKRVKEWTPNTHPSAPPGTLQRVKFPNSQAGSKGYKRDPTPEELEMLKKTQVKNSVGPK